MKLNYIKTNHKVPKKYYLKLKCHLTIYRSSKATEMAKLNIREEGSINNLQQIKN